VQEAFQERLHDLRLYHSRLSEALSSINREISGLSADLEATKAFMNSRFGWPITVNIKNREFRDGRLGIELVEDNVEEELELERQVLESVKQDNFDMLVSEAEDLLVLMKTKAGELARDIGRKSAAIKVDERNSKMRLGEKGSGLFLPDVVRKPGDSLETSEWTEVCELLLTESTEAYKDAGDLREKMKTSATLSDQLVKEHESAVNKSFAGHLIELNNARENSAALLKENKEAIFDCEQEIDMLRTKLDEQVEPLQRATTRLHDRRKRPDVERTCDIVHQSLVQEVAEIDGVCTALTGELEMAEANLAELRKVEGILEEDFAMKSKSINIDQKCMKLRSFLSDSADPQKVKMMQRGGSWIEWGLRWASA
jgi:tektin-3